jgi:hypothetical protein
MGETADPAVFNKPISFINARQRASWKASEQTLGQEGKATFSELGRTVTREGRSEWASSSLALFLLFPTRFLKVLLRQEGGFPGYLGAIFFCCLGIKREY